MKKVIKEDILIITNFCSIFPNLFNTFIDIVRVLSSYLCPKYLVLVNPIKNSKCKKAPKIKLFFWIIYYDGT